jgi:hypothetical protein
MTVFAPGILFEGGASAYHCTKTQELGSRKTILPKDYRVKFESAFYIFIQARGDITTREINALVDLLDGHKKDDIINRPRRLLP